jgi:hypothetical protein
MLWFVACAVCRCVVAEVLTTVHSLIYRALSPCPLTGGESSVHHVWRNVARAHNRRRCDVDAVHVGVGI